VGWTTQKLVEHIEILHRQGLIYSSITDETQKLCRGRGSESGFWLKNAMPGIFSLVCLA
jgi:hypothetical protein